MEKEASKADSAEELTGHAALPAPKVTWLVFKNAVVQAGGRNLGTVAKFIGYILIVRIYGPEWFGQFSVIIALLAISEVLLEFGYGDIFVRDLCQEPENRHRLLSALAYSKLFQIVAAYALLVFLLLVLRYPRELTLVGLVAGLELVFMGVVMVYRVVFKADLQMERDAIGEIVCSLVFLGFVVWICTRGLGFYAMFCGFVISRGIYSLIALSLGHREFDLRTSRWDTAEVRSKFMAAMPFGLSIFTAVLFNSQDILMLSKMDTMHSVGIYSVAYRFVHPLVIVAVSLMAGLFPILASYWGQRMDELRRLYQLGVDLSIALAGMAFCFIYASAGFLVSLWGENAIEATFTLKVLGFAIAAFFVSSMVGPMWVMVRARWLALCLGFTGVLFNFLLNWVLIPRYSCLGAAIATVLTEVGLMFPGFWYIQRKIGLRLRWWKVPKVAVAAGVSLIVVNQLGLMDSFLGGVLAVILYCVAALLTRTVSPEQLRGFYQNIKNRERD